jgi:predicted DNA-binding protein
MKNPALGGVQWIRWRRIGGIMVCMKRTHLFLPQPLIDRLKALSEKLDVSMAELIRRAIEDFLKKNEK